MLILREMILAMFLSVKKNNKLDKLVDNIIVGSSSRRRELQLKLINKNISVIHIRGNIDTRIKKLEKEKIDGIVLAAAGIESLDLKNKVNFFFKTEPIKISIQNAKKIEKGPVILADHGDVAGSGGSTDIPIVLSEVLSQGLESVCAGPFWDPETVKRMVATGVGNAITVDLGGKTNFPAINFLGTPLKLTGVVKCITDGKFRVTGPKIPELLKT